MRFNISTFISCYSVDPRGHVVTTFYAACKLWSVCRIMVRIQKHRIFSVNNLPRFRELPPSSYLPVFYHWERWLWIMIQQNEFNQCLFLSWTCNCFVATPILFTLLLKATSFPHCTFSQVLSGASAQHPTYLYSQTLFLLQQFSQKDDTISSAKSKRMQKMFKNVTVIWIYPS